MICKLTNPIAIQSLHFRPRNTDCPIDPQVEFVSQVNQLQALIEPFILFFQRDILVDSPNRNQFYITPINPLIAIS